MPIRVRQKEQKRTLSDLIGQTRHRSATEHGHHFRAEGEAYATDAEGGHQGDRNRNPGNRIGQLFAGHRKRTGDRCRNGDARDQSEFGDVRPVISDCTWLMPSPKLISAAVPTTARHAEADRDGGTSDQFPITDRQTKGQAEDGVHQRGDDHGPNDDRRAVGDQPEGGDHRRTNQKNEEAQRRLG